jgi:hypothetical protein
LENELTPEMPESASRNDTKYFWIIGDYQGKTLVYGYELTSEAAWAKGYQNLDCPFDILPYYSKDKAKVSAHLKARKLEGGSGIDNALQRMKHKI